jgi:hypothetical protein
MTKKVKLAIIDADLKARKVGLYEVADGSKIRVKSGGEGHFMPTFDNDSFVELPRPWWKGGGWDKVYMAKKGASACIKFKHDPPIIPAPDPKQVMDAANAVILTKFGVDEQKTPFILYLVAGLNILIFLILLGVINV